MTAQLTANPKGKARLAPAIALTATLGLALTFTFSCSSDDGGGGSDKGNDIKNYKTVKIGDQVWMAENLNYAISGSKCYGEGSGCNPATYNPAGGNNKETLSNAEIQANCLKYGRLYDWSTAMALPDSCKNTKCSNQIQAKHRGICPAGWHIPSMIEWGTLITRGNLIGNPLIDMYKNGYYDYYDYYNYYWINVDTSSFAALPGGRGLYDGEGSYCGVGGYIYWDVGNGGFWWSASEPEASSRSNPNLNIIAGSVNTNSSESEWKERLFSIRCLQD